VHLGDFGFWPKWSDFIDFGRERLEQMLELEPQEHAAGGARRASAELDPRRET
jgi:hypothetical protein